MRLEPMSKIRVSVAGATGYSGGELVALLARHPRVELASVHAGTSGTSSLPEALVASRGSEAIPALEPFSLDRIARVDPDAVFLATPNEASARVVPRLLESGIAVIDLSGAFRLRDASDYPRWYGFEHPAPELLSEAVYGLTEWCDDLPGSRLVANPGCYPTSVLLAVKPLQPLLAPAGPVVCDSASGVSGAGRRAEIAYSFAEVAGNFKAYGIGTHRHEPEIRSGLRLRAETPFVFVAHLLPAVRGILSTIHVEFARPLEVSDIEAAYARAYAGSAFVRVLPAGSVPELRQVTGTPRAEIGFVLLPGGDRAVLVSALDNLLKGAASQAIQNFNVVFGLPESAGLQEREAWE